MQISISSRSLFAASLALVLGACGGGGGGDDEAGDIGEEGTDGFEPGGCADVCGTPGCGSCPASEQVEGEGLRIDAREVDNGQYAALLAVDFDRAVLPPGCEWKLGFVPQGWSTALDPALPVVGVDWCDAMVFCTWAGKQLCGSISGGAANWDDALAADDAWYSACSRQGAQAYPYGDQFDPSACNGEGSAYAEIEPSGSATTCEGGITGLFDMSGNVWEWTNACAGADGDGATLCRRRGGSHYSGEDSLRCGVDSERPRAERDSAVGFRCCG